MSSNLLSASLVKRILAHLAVRPASPRLSFLDELVTAYTRTVPWETAFRIARRADVADTAVCPRWPEQFWQEAVTLGSGGTCFESNYAFFALLQTLGFHGYLTINNMGEKIGCHSAIIVLLGEEKWLADVGLPLYAPLPVNPDGETRRITTFQHYTVRPDGRNRYQIERFPHPNRNAFTLIDEPVPDDIYRARVVADYGEDGLFLEKVIAHKIVDGRPWRFNMEETPWRLSVFGWGTRDDYDLDGDPATAVAEFFGMDTAVVRQAFALTDSHAE